MPKHLYFNPKNFNELVLSGVLIELFKTDVEVHSNEEGSTLRFVQGENVVENNIENILRFANSISGHKIFGRNWQQEAVINMINGVCKDIEKKLSVSVSSSQLTEKIEDLNLFWFKKSSEWLKKRFFACHMEILILSFSIQEKYPEILTKYQCFVELRRLFIEQKLLSKASLIAMFTHPENKYQEFDLFPELESSVHEVRRSMGSTYGEEDMGEFIKDNMESSYVEITAQEIDINEMKQQTTTENVTQQQSETVTLNTEQNQQTYVQSQEHHIVVQTIQNIQNNQLQGESYISTVNDTDPSSYIPSPENQASKIDPQQIVMSKIKQHESAIVTNMPSEVEVISEEVQHQVSQVQVKIQEYKEHQHANQQQKNTNQQHQHIEQQYKNQIKQEKPQQQQPQKIQTSLKVQILQHLTKPIYCSSNDLVDQEVAMTQNVEVSKKEEELCLQQPVLQAIPHQQNHIIQNNKQELNQQPLKANATFQIKNQVHIEKKQTQNNVTLENPHHQKEKSITKNQENQEPNLPQKKIQSNHVQPLQQQKNKAPEQQSHNASVKGPQSTMENKKIKPKQQTVVAHKQTCKCQIF